MVFSNLQEKEKDAFFSLLDDYFQSRPEIFAALSGQKNNASDSNNGGGKSSGATIGQRLFSASPAAAFGSGPPKPRVGGGFSGSPGPGGRGASASSDASPQEQQQEDPQPVAGRVAAAAAAFAQHRLSTPGGLSSSSSSSSGGAAAAAGTPSRLSGVDTSSLRNALAGRASQSGPPPAYNKTSAAAPPPVARRGPPQPEPEPEPEPEEEEGPQGEWAEVLYDYVSDEPGDLNISENQQILVTQKNSDDWWTGEVDGRSGLFPASYVKLL
ncbi:hypothetical protein AX14_006967 [Amanita brunnescens Koide BX004]|nr:hypothetical protein AX14_006967 [Amanita brunnescens Koide BX004]